MQDSFEIWEESGSTRIGAGKPREQQRPATVATTQVAPGGDRGGDAVGRRNVERASNESPVDALLLGTRWTRDDAALALELLSVIAMLTLAYAAWQDS